METAHCYLLSANVLYLILALRMYYLTATSQVSQMGKQNLTSGSKITLGAIGLLMTLVNFFLLLTNDPWMESEWYKSQRSW